MIESIDNAMYVILDAMEGVNFIGIRPALTVGKVEFPRIVLVRAALQLRTRELKPLSYLRYEDPDTDEHTVTFRDGTIKTGRIGTIKRKHPIPYDVWYDVRLQTMKTSEDRALTELVLATFPFMGGLTLEDDTVLPIHLESQMNSDEYVGQAPPSAGGATGYETGARGVPGSVKHSGLPSFEKVFRYVVNGFLDVYPPTTVKAILTRIFEYRNALDEDMTLDESVLIETKSYAEDEP